MKNFKTKVYTLLIAVPLLVLLALFLLSGDNFDIIKNAFTGNFSEEDVRDHLSALGMRGYLSIAFLSMLQVVLVFLPAEPVQVLGGLAFGWEIAFIACICGIIVGNTIIFLLYKAYGDKLRSFFDTNVNIDLESADRVKKVTLVTLVLYFIPAIPYGIIAFLAGASGLKYYRYIFVTTLGCIPSVLIGVGLGHITLENPIYVTAAIFIVFLVCFVFLMLKRDFFISKINEYLEKKKNTNRSKTTVKEYKSSKLILPYIIFRICVLGKIKFKITERVEKIERPSIVLCNHGAFIDFAYSGTILRKESPNYVVARLYFYNKWLSKLLKSFGCFPKSIFAVDTDSALNCVRVIKRGGVLAMMPEARLSTVGKFEDIQYSTFDFLKKMGVTVYAIKINGDYLAKPKWGTGIRRGSLVEAKMSLLFTPQELSELTLDQIKSRTEEALDYNEMQWLESHPQIKYRSKKMAVGLENILTRCPNCDSLYSMTSFRRTLKCQMCGLSTTVGNRYEFSGNVPFNNFVEWYDWQTEKIRESILSNPDFSLSANVTLKHASYTGKKRLQAVGNGVCTLSREGLKYVGTEYGESTEKLFPLSNVYRVLFGAGVDFEIYVGKDIYFFVPSEKRSCVDWYIASKILYDCTFGS